MIFLFLILNAFGENLFKKYDSTDATTEILLMLIGAAVIGFLVRHFIGFRKKEFIIEQKGEVNSNLNANDSSDLSDQIERLRDEIDRLAGLSGDHSNAVILKSQTKGGGGSKSKQETTTLGDISALASLKSAEVKSLGDLVFHKAENDKSENSSGKRKMVDRDDLKVIEGIGPALERLLNENGIISYDQLSNHKVSQLKEILDKAGPRFRVHIPETWPEQAGLLRDGKIAAFSALTQKLKGGRRV
jgi:predicted flap endonuclease-1-like 5' DNA nuclease